MAKSKFEKSIQDMYAESLFNQILFGWMQGYAYAKPEATQMEAAYMFCEKYKLDIDASILPVTYNRLHKRFVDVIKISQDD